MQTRALHLVLDARIRPQLQQHGRALHEASSKGTVKCRTPLRPGLVHRRALGDETLHALGVAVLGHLVQLIVPGHRAARCSARPAPGATLLPFAQTSASRELVRLVVCVVCGWGACGIACQKWYCTIVVVHAVQVNTQGARDDRRETRERGGRGRERARGGRHARALRSRGVYGPGGAARGSGGCQSNLARLASTHYSLCPLSSITGDPSSQMAAMVYAHCIHFHEWSSGFGRGGASSRA